MNEPQEFKADRRVIFPSDKQRKFLAVAIRNLKLSWVLFSDKIEVNKRTLNDWRRGKHSLPFKTFKRICSIAKLKPPADIEIRQPFWSAKKAARIAGR